MRAIILGCCCGLFLAPGMAPAADPPPAGPPYCVTPTPAVVKSCTSSPVSELVDWSLVKCGPPSNSNAECDAQGPKINWPSGNQTTVPPHTQPGTYWVTSPTVQLTYTFTPKPGYAGTCPAPVTLTPQGTVQVVVSDCNCNGVAYDPNTQGCCNGQTVYTLATQCCPIDSVLQKCGGKCPISSGGLAGGGIPIPESCCNGSLYSYPQQCCNDKTVFTPGSQCCLASGDVTNACGGQCPALGQECCNGQLIYRYVNTCCNGTIYPLGWGCCNGVAFQQGLGSCCVNNILVHSPAGCNGFCPKPGEGCCNGQLMTSSQCCQNGTTVVAKCGNSCPAPGQLCCAGQLYSKPNICCGGQVHGQPAWQDGPTVEMEIPARVASSISTIGTAMGVTLGSPTVSVSTSAMDCCKNNQQWCPGGATKGSVSVSWAIPSGEVGVPGWSTPVPISINKTIGGVTLSLEAKGGVYVIWGGSLGGTVGFIKSQCDPSAAANCTFCKVEAAISGGVSAQIKALGCVAVPGWWDGGCAGVDLSASATAELSGSVAYNQPNCGDPLQANAAIGDIKLKITASYPPWGKTSISVPLDGFTIL